MLCNGEQGADEGDASELYLTHWGSTLVGGENARQGKGLAGWRMTMTLHKIQKAGGKSIIHLERVRYLWAIQMFYVQ